MTSLLCSDIGDDCLPKLGVVVGSLNLMKVFKEKSLHLKYIYERQVMFSCSISITKQCFFNPIFPTKLAVIEGFFILV